MSREETPEREVLVDACGCERTPPPSTGGGEVEEPVTRLWHVREIRLGLLSGALLGVGFLAGLGGWETVELVLAAAALLVGGSTFVPGALRRLARGKLGVGLLMHSPSVVGVGRVRFPRLRTQTGSPHTMRGVGRDKKPS